MEELTTALLGLLALVAILIFISLTATAIFRPSKLAMLIEAYKVIGLALIGRQYSKRKRDEQDDGKPPSDDDPPDYGAQ